MGKYKPNSWQILDDKLNNEWDNNHHNLKWDNFKGELINDIKSLFDDIDSIVDLGCCLGYYIEKLREIGFKGEYLGVDITPSFIERAKKKYPDENFKVGNVRNINLDKKYDLVMCLGVLMHLPDLKPIKEICKQSNKYVLLMSYSTDNGKTKKTYDKNKKFISNYWSEQDLLKEIPEGWEIIKNKFLVRRRIILLKKK